MSNDPTDLAGQPSRGEGPGGPGKPDLTLRVPNLPPTTALPVPDRSSAKDGPRPDPADLLRTSGQCVHLGLTPPRPNPPAPVSRTDADAAQPADLDEHTVVIPAQQARFPQPSEPQSASTPDPQPPHQPYPQPFGHAPAHQSWEHAPDAGGPGGFDRFGFQPAGEPADERSPRRRFVLFGVGGAVALFAALYGGAVAYAGDGVPRGTTVRGVDIGGLSPQEAERTLVERLGPRASEPMTVQVDDEQLRLDPKRAGLGFDPHGTVAAAGTRSLNPIKLFGSLFGSRREIAPKITVDEEQLRASLELVAEQVAERPREGSITFENGRPKAVLPREGRTVDTAAAEQAIRAGYLSAEGITLPTVVVKPKVTREEVERAMKEFAEPAVSGPVVVSAEGKKARLPVRVFAKHLSMVPDTQGRLQPKLEAVELYADAEDVLDPLQQKPQDATFKIVGGRPTVVPSKPGKVIKPTELAKSVLAVLPKRTGRIAVVQLQPEQPKLTTEKAKSLGVKEVIGTWTTHYVPAPYKNVNIHRAADLIRGSVILPGEEWSLNKTVGERTAANGFVKGLIINEGRLYEDYGGGTSAVATTTFNAAFFSGVKLLEFHPHSFYISIYPEGREATVAWPYKDLRFRNTLNSAIVIDTAYTDSSVTVTFWGTKEYDVEAGQSPRYNVRPPREIVDDSVNCANQNPQPGFEVDVYRLLRKNGRLVKKETFHVKYNPADKITCRNREQPQQHR